MAGHNETSAVVAELSRRRRTADAIWMLALLVGGSVAFVDPLVNLIPVGDGTLTLWIYVICGTFLVIGGVWRTRMTRAIWAADPDNAPKPWKRTWLMDREDLG